MRRRQRVWTRSGVRSEGNSAGPRLIRAMAISTRSWPGDRGGEGGSIVMIEFGCITAAEQDRPRSGSRTVNQRRERRATAELRPRRCGNADSQEPGIKNSGQKREGPRRSTQHPATCKR